MTPAPIELRTFPQRMARHLVDWLLLALAAAVVWGSFPCTADASGPTDEPPAHHRPAARWCTGP